MIWLRVIVILASLRITMLLSKCEASMEPSLMVDRIFLSLYSRTHLCLCFNTNFYVSEKEMLLLFDAKTQNKASGTNAGSLILCLLVCINYSTHNGDGVPR